jgi:hypothetical protein
MRYPDSHWDRVAELYREHGSVAGVQDHYPDTTQATVRRWLRVCRTRGLL